MKKQVIDFRRFQEIGGASAIELNRRRRICALVCGALDDWYNLTTLDVYRTICKHLDPDRPWSIIDILNAVMSEFEEYSGVLLYEDSPWESIVLRCNCKITVHLECIDGDWIPVPWLE